MQYPGCDPATATPSIRAAEKLCRPSLERLCPEQGKRWSEGEWQQCYLRNRHAVPTKCRDRADKALQCTNVVESWNKCTDVFKADTLRICKADIKTFCSKALAWANQDKSVVVDINERLGDSTQIFKCLRSKRPKLSQQCQNHLYSEEDRSSKTYFANTNMLRLPGSKVMDAAKWSLNKLQTCVQCTGLGRAAGVVDQKCLSHRHRLCSRTNPLRPKCCDGAWSECYANESNRPIAKHNDECESNVDYLGDDLRQVKNVASYELCDEACLKDPACNAWTWASPSFTRNRKVVGVCFLKRGYNSGMRRTDAGQRGLVSGKVGCSGSVAETGLNQQRYKGYYRSNIQSAVFKSPVGKQTRVVTVRRGDDGTRYSWQWWGSFRPTRAGRYCFWTNSDDASHVYVDSKLVVNNGGDHGMRVRSGCANYKVGSYPFHIYFGENGGKAGIQFKWSGPGQSWTTNLNNIFFTGSTRSYLKSWNATGCPNKKMAPKDSGWWDKQTSYTVFKDMYAYCSLTKSGRANAFQVKACCGATACKPTSCERQTTWNTAPKLDQNILEWESCRSAVLSMKTCWKNGQVEEMHRRFEEYEEQQIALKAEREREAAEKRREQLRMEAERKREAASKQDHKITLQKQQLKIDAKLDAEVKKARAAANAKAQAAKAQAARAIRKAQQQADRRVAAAKKREAVAFAAAERASKAAEKAKRDQASARNAQELAQKEAHAAKLAQRKATDEAVRATAAKRKADIAHKKAVEAQRNAHTEAQRQLAKAAAAAAKRAAEKAAEKERRARAVIAAAQRKQQAAQAAARLANDARANAERQAENAMKAKRASDNDARKARASERAATKAQRKATQERKRAREQARRDVRAAEEAARKAVQAAKRKSDLEIQRARKTVKETEARSKNAIANAERSENAARVNEKKARRAESNARRAEKQANLAASRARQQAALARKSESKAKLDAKRARAEKARAAEAARLAAIEAKKAADAAARTSADKAEQAAFKKAAAKAAQVARKTSLKAKAAQLAADLAEQKARKEVADAKDQENSSKLEEQLAVAAAQTARKLAKEAKKDQQLANQQAKLNNVALLKVTEAARKLENAREALRLRKEKAAFSIRTGTWSDTDCQRTTKELKIARKLEAELEAAKRDAEKNRLALQEKWAKERKAETRARSEEAVRKSELDKKIARDRQQELEQKKAAVATPRPVVKSSATAKPTTKPAVPAKPSPASTPVPSSTWVLRTKGVCSTDARRVIGGVQRLDIEDFNACKAWCVKYSWCKGVLFGIPPNHGKKYKLCRALTTKQNNGAKVATANQNKVVKSGPARWRYAGQNDWVSASQWKPLGRQRSLQKLQKIYSCWERVTANPGPKMLN